MKKSILRVLSLAWCVAWSVGLLCAQVPCKRTHLVKKKETIYSITHQYGITEQELIAANPILKSEPLKADYTLCIPDHNANAVSRPAVLPGMNVVPRGDKPVNVAVILPFQTDVSSPNAEQTLMVEYYQGFLLALEQLKTENISVNLSVFDSGMSVESLGTLLLTTPALEEMDLVFGPGYAEQVAVLAEFVSRTQARLVVPFTSKGNEIETRPHMYQVNTPKAQLYQTVYERMMGTFGNVNYVVLDAEDGNADKADFIQGLKDKAKANGQTVNTLKGDQLLSDNVTRHLNRDMENVLVPNSGTNAALFKLLPQLIVAHRENPDFHITLFGYPEWQRYLDEHLSSFYELNTYFYSSFFTNQLSSETSLFARKFQRTFNKDLANTYPQYALLGYDTAYYFIRGFHLFDTDLETNLNDFAVSTIQTGFRFIRVNNEGGYNNRKVYFIHFSPSYELKKIDFD